MPDLAQLLNITLQHHTTVHPACCASLLMGRQACLFLSCGLARQHGGNSNLVHMHFFEVSLGSSRAMLCILSLKSAHAGHNMSPVTQWASVTDAGIW